jgi:hypothetical protein
MNQEQVDALPFPFRSELDRRMALQGPAAIFTLDARGQLQFDAARTRDSWDRLEDEMARIDGVKLAPCPCLFRDRETGWVQFVFSTSEQLCGEHPRADIRVFPDTQTALQELQSLGVPPVLTASFPEGPE